MTWQPGEGSAAPGGPADDATRADWAMPPAPPPATGAVPTPPPAASAPPPPPPSASGPAAPGSAWGPAGGTPPGQPPIMWAPPPVQSGFGPGSSIEYGGVLSRFVAWFVDGLIIGLVSGLIVAPLYLIALGSLDWAQLATPGYRSATLVATGALLAVTAVVAVIGLVLNVAYFVLQWTSGARATLGMRLMHLQVAGASDGRTLTRQEGLRRWLAMGSWVSVFSVIPVVGSLASLGLFVWEIVLLVSTASSPVRQGIHDRFAGSAVIQPVGTSNSGCVVAFVVVVGIIAVISLLSIVALIFLGGQVSSILSNVGRSI